jgi:hypothetical protein
MANPFSSSAAPLPSNPCTQISCASVFLGALGRPGSAYLCGPMRGFPSWNAAAFDECAGRWRDAGWLVVNPVGLASGLDVRSASEAQLDAVAGDPAWLRNVILADCSHVAKADALALLPGWEASFGATVEVSLALFLGLPLFCAVTMHRIVITLRCPLLGLGRLPVITRMAIGPKFGATSQTAGSLMWYNSSRLYAH